MREIPSLVPLLSAFQDDSAPCSLVINYFSVTVIFIKEMHGIVTATFIISYET